jgi:L-asparaginase
MTKNPDIKRILILFCGGTISMHKDEATGTLLSSHAADQLFSLEPRLREVADFDVHYVCNMDSTNLAISEWEAMTRLIEESYDKYDAFLITQGTNTLAFTSSALSFSLQGLGKPVVLTGAQIPVEAMSTDGRNNFINAVRVCCMNLAGVFVVFGSKIILGCRAKKVSEAELDAFNSFNDGDFGEINIGIRINKTYTRRHGNFPAIRNGFEPNIICLTMIPGFNTKFIDGLLDSGAKGLIIRAVGSGDLPYDWLPSLERATAMKIPVLVTTQCRGSTIMGVNDPGYRLLGVGAIQVFDMSMEAMSTKLMWLLKQNTPFEKMKERIQTNIAGEINTSRSQYLLNAELSSLPDYQRILQSQPAT